MNIGLTAQNSRKSLMERIFGAPGFYANKNLLRGKGKGVAVFMAMLFFFFFLLSLSSFDTASSTLFMSGICCGRP